MGEGTRGERLAGPARAAGRACSVDAAVASAAELLAGADLPLVYGLVQSTVEAQRQAVRLADLLHGVVDSAASPAHEPSLQAYAQLGGLTATLGELRRRADLVLFWGCDPDRLHAGFVERLAGPRPGRYRLAIDLASGRGPASVPDRLSIPPESELHALLALRALVSQERVDPRLAEPPGLAPTALRELARRLAACDYGVILHEGDPPPDHRDVALAMALGALVGGVTRKAHLRQVGVRGPGNPAGAENVLTWQTGFPGSISFNRGYPRYGPGEFTADALLARRDVDAALLVGVDPARHLPPAAVERVGEVPLVWLGAPEAPAAERSQVSIATLPFVSTPGHVYRMDGLALRHHAQPGDAAADWPSEAAVLASIAAAVEARLSGGRA